MKRHPLQIILILLAVMLLMVACDQKKGVIQPNPTFDIVAFNVPELVSSSSDHLFLLTAQISHPDGAAGIESVEIQIYTPGDSLLKTVEMKDDGFITPADSSGDVIAGDQIYSRLLNPRAFAGNQGVYRFALQVKAVNETELPALDKTIEIVKNGKPEILSFLFPDSIYAGLSGHTASFVVSDPDGVADVQWLLIEGTAEGATTPTMFDTLVNPQNGLNNFSMNIDSSYAAGRTGKFTLRFFAEDRFGEKSDAMQQNVAFENSAPLVWQSSVPDTLTRPASGSLPIEITVHVKDGQSLADVDMVYFDSYLPGGNPSSGNPFVMYDNGLVFDPNNAQAVGDTLAGDGIYTLTIFLGATVPVGAYEFHFFAQDKVGQTGQGPVAILNITE